jgi:ankyrin repeat protein
VNRLETLRKEARFWLKQVRGKHSGFTKRLRLAYPGVPAAPTLRHIQHALAREHGYQNWTALVTAIGEQPAPGEPRGGGPVSNFLGFACWDHLTHGRGDYAAIAAAAMRLLDRHPEIASADIYTAVVCGNRARVEQLLTEQPSLADRRGGLRNWEPLLYLCYARLPIRSLRQESVAIARLLLDRGANPNAYYMAGHSVYGALVGVAGDGEQDAPPHPARDELYALLLQRGAEPYDDQVLYNTHFRGDVLWWLKLTWQYSVAAGRQRDWADSDLPIFDMGGYGSGARFLLWLAIRKNNRDLAEWLLERGANPNARPPRASTLPQMSLHRYAVLEGRQDIADLLLRHGATRDDAMSSDDEMFAAACMQLDRETAAAIARRRSEYLQSPNVLCHAARLDRSDVVALLLDLGVRVNSQDSNGRTALHAAAGSDARAAAILLLERGADANIREAQYHATPLGMASHYDHRAMIDLLTPYSRDVWSLTSQGKIDRLREVLAAEPQRATEIGPHGSTLLWHLPNDEERALQVVELLLAYGADPSVKGEDGTMAADSARALGQQRIAERLERANNVRPTGVSS